MAGPPPDRSHLSTEQRHPDTGDLHRRTPAELVELFAVAGTREVLAAMQAAAPAIAAVVTAAAPGFTRGGRLVYLGAGTSGRLGVLDASEAPPTFCVEPGRIVGIIAGGDGALRRSSEGAEDDPCGALPQLAALALTADDTVIGIAAGGTTPYVQGALAWCLGVSPGTQLPAPSSQHPVCCLLTCADIAAPAGALRIHLPTGPEALTGSTRMKAGTATKLALNAISTALMALSGRIHGNLMVDVKASNVKLMDRAARIVAALTGLPRADCFPLLERAGGSAKTAIVMHRRGLDRAAAEEMLVGCAGRLDTAVGSGREGHSPLPAPA